MSEEIISKVRDVRKKLPKQQPQPQVGQSMLERLSTQLLVKHALLFVHQAMLTSDPGS